MKKNIFLYFIFVIILTLSVVSFISCNNTKKENENKELILSYSNMNLDLFEKKEINVTLNSEDVIAEWKSSNNNIAYYDNGKIIACSEGEAIITAKKGPLIADCKVTVYDSGERPYLSVNSDIISIGYECETYLQPVIKYKNVKLNCIFICGEYDQEIIECNVLNDKILLNGKNIGETNIEIKGIVDNYELMPVIISLSVVDKISLICSECNIYLSTIEYNGEKNYQQIDIKVIGADNTEILNPQIEWTTSDANIAVFNQKLNRIESSGSSGKAVIIAKYNNIETEINVNVHKAIIDMGNVPICLGGQDKVKNISLDKITGNHIESLSEIEEIIDVTENKKLNYSINDTSNSIYLLDDLPVIGQHLLMVETAKISFKSIVVNATYIINQVSDFIQLGDDYIKATSGNINYDYNYSNKTDDWYVVLNNDIDFENQKITDKSTYTENGIRIYNKGFGSNNSSDGYTAVFNGVFDGRGHIIKNMSSYNGFITNLGKKGVIRNVAFKNIKKTFDYQGGLLGNYIAGTVENIFIEGEIDDSKNVGGLYQYGNGKFFNVIAKIEFNSNPLGIFKNLSNNKANAYDSYAISSTTNKIDGSGTIGDYIYPNLKEWKSNIIQLPENYNNFWYMGTNYLKFGNAKILEW